MFEKTRTLIWNRKSRSYTFFCEDLASSALKNKIKIFKKTVNDSLVKFDRYLKSLSPLNSQH